MEYQYGYRGEHVLHAEVASLLVPAFIDAELDKGTLRQHAGQLPRTAERSK